jgi:alkylation response protein AidB-like acyl-CoA dehydrogenase
LSVSHYLVDRRDLLFVLNEQLGLGKLTELPKYKDFDQGDFDLVLDEAIKVATELLSGLNKVADEQQCKLVDGKVVLPDGFVPAFKTFCEAGWVSPHGNPEHGGQGLPFTLTVSLSELFIGANPSFFFLPALTAAAANVLEDFGSEAHKQRFLEPMLTGRWTGTMCLTEPQAGSAVGELTTSARPLDGTERFALTGSKIFISAGDHEAAENIIHLVLARVEGDPAGTKGLSLFIVPKYKVDEAGRVGESNDVVTTALEHKMGINGSPTCALAFGENGDCEGYLLGERRMGIVYMFKMMNEARIMCGIQCAAAANASYQQALAYARDRVQGTRATSKSDERVAIIEHPDVRRNLLWMKSVSEGLRALLHQAAYWADLAVGLTDEKEVTRYQDLLELLTPICKAYATDMGFYVTEKGIQVLGGYGYVREYPLEQYMRDVKIASLYEGTNGIQALDLLGRKMRLKGGGLFMNWLQEANGSLQPHKDHPELGTLVQAVDKAKNALGEVTFAFPALGQKDPELFILQATPFLRAFGHVEVARQLVLQALIAQKALDALAKKAGAESPEQRRALLQDDSEARFYDGKVQAARFFVGNVLPETFSLAKSMKTPDRSALDIVF